MVTIVIVEDRKVFQAEVVDKDAEALCRIYKNGEYADAFKKVHREFLKDLKQVESPVISNQTTMIFVL